ncbi:MAG: leucine--tRNA ligase [Thermoguttaceae bacterium]|nr:leucine--tRNA ligase [Thermoguttaceae bacterium]MDW8038585.1 leucine--tRNA ligase [Thermoguttaceae bacterium]
MPRYNPAVIEPKWQKYWEENKTFRTPRLPVGKKIYILDMFPYPSGEGLHVGHPEGYTATDIVARYKRMKGYCVMHPMGWDAFGLPAEQHAKKTGIHPRLTTEKNIATFRRQLKMLGFSYDWDRELATTDLEYFRWTQFIFLVLYDTWYDPQQERGRAISELPIPPEVAEEGPDAIERYRDEHRLAYQLEAPVNWCPALGTVLANEEVVGGLSERGGHPVIRIPLRQWMLRITAYADRLLKDLDLLDWPENIKTLQRNWIGRSTGAEVDFFIGTFLGPDGKPSRKEYEGWRFDRQLAGFPRKPDESVLRIYTTRPDTLFGATYMVIAPEHPLVRKLTAPERREAVEAYCAEAARKSDLDRTDLAKVKTGVFTGSYAINPVNDQAIPIWVADYVLATYGTGAIMAVPAHDTRDFEFARQYGLPIVPVVDPGEANGSLRQEVLAGRLAYVDDGVAINSGPYDGLPTVEFKKRITEDLAAKGLGRFAVNYRLRDWIFSRQHFWGEPFPLLHELDEQGRPTGRVVPLSPDELPLDLPANMPFDAKHDTPEPPLEKAPPEWLYVTRNGRRYKRETNTMPQWAGSCWYYLRFLDPRNDKAMVDPEIERAWMPVDLYVGGAEHAVLHLLYARFWHKVLYDRGYVSTPEPFMKLVNQGMILGEMEFTGYQDANGQWISASEVDDPETGHQATRKTDGQPVRRIKLDPSQVEKQDNIFVLKEAPHIRVDARAYKMSKSRGNVINPDDIVANYGADTLRLYEMFMGPLEAVKPWSMEGVSGVRNFLDRVWRMLIDERSEHIQLHPAVQDVEPTPEQNRILHRTIKAVTEDIEQMAFNTAIARMMEFTNFFTKQSVRPRRAMEQFVLLLSPFAPHIAEELWQALGHQQTLAYEPWPTYDEQWIKQETIEVPVQINGKVRSRVRVPAEADAQTLETAARNEPRICQLLAGKQIKKVIVVPGRMVNIVVQ